MPDRFPDRFMVTYLVASNAHPAFRHAQHTPCDPLLTPHA